MVECCKIRAKAQNESMGPPPAPHASLLCLLTSFLVSVSLAAANPPDGFNDGIDRTAPNFVTASLLVMSPGDELYSCAGHSVLRLECPTLNLDNCFTYESESGELGGMATAKDFLAVAIQEKSCCRRQLVRVVA